MACLDETRQLAARTACLAEETAWSAAQVELGVASMWCNLLAFHRHCPTSLGCHCHSHCYLASKESLMGYHLGGPSSHSQKSPENQPRVSQMSHGLMNLQSQTSFRIRSSLGSQRSYRLSLGSHRNRLSLATLTSFRTRLSLESPTSCHIRSSFESLSCHNHLRNRCWGCRRSSHRLRHRLGQRWRTRPQRPREQSRTSYLYYDVIERVNSRSD